MDQTNSPGIHISGMIGHAVITITAFIVALCSNGNLASEIFFTGVIVGFFYSIFIFVLAFRNWETWPKRQRSILLVLAVLPLIEALAIVMMASQIEC